MENNINLNRPAILRRSDLLYTENHATLLLDIYRHILIKSSTVVNVQKIYLFLPQPSRGLYIFLLLINSVTYPPIMATVLNNSVDKL